MTPFQLYLLGAAFAAAILIASLVLWNIQLSKSVIHDIKKENPTKISGPKKLVISAPRVVGMAGNLTAFINYSEICKL